VTWWQRGSRRSESRRARRQRAIRLLRSQGRYGPELREVLPALTATVLAVAGTLAAVMAAYRAVGIGAPLAALAVLALAVPLAVRHHRPLARRRLGYYSPEELADLDTPGLALAVSRMLRRDGWRVRLPSQERVRPRLQARHRHGHRLEVAFRPVAEPLPDEDPPLPRLRRTAAGSPLRLIVHRGVFSHRDRRWARSRDDTRLVDGSLLNRWAQGTPLHELVALTTDPTEHSAG
jgi:hypothetical protein